MLFQTRAAALRRREAVCQHGPQPARAREAWRSRVCWGAGWGEGDVGKTAFARKEDGGAGCAHARALEEGGKGGCGCGVPTVEVGLAGML